MVIGGLYWGKSATIVSRTYPIQDNQESLLYPFRQHSMHLIKEISKRKDPLRSVSTTKYDGTHRCEGVLVLARVSWNTAQSTTAHYTALHRAVMGLLSDTKPVAVSPSDARIIR